MTLIDEIQSFSRDFINIKSFRTRSRKAKIREAYKLLTGQDIKISCNTCYIEALFIIIKSKPMATPNYQLKKGVLLTAFGDASKTCTNDTLTDELAEWYLKNYPQKAIYFERIPVTPVVTISPDVIIIPPKKTEEEKKTESTTNLISDTLNAVSGTEEKKEVKKTVKKAVKSKK